MFWRFAVKLCLLQSCQESTSSPHLVPGATASCKPLILLHRTGPMMQGQESMNVKIRCWVFHSEGSQMDGHTARQMENFKPSDSRRHIENATSTVKISTTRQHRSNSIMFKPHERNLFFTIRASPKQQ
ncbi:hypothetical protein CI102_12098 [Trichoderma harzianum]|nr:hypothetical protein CI102_12098 [Trichoderma harzianum]